MELHVLQVHGGTVFHAESCFIRPHYALAISVIHSAAIVGSVQHE